MPVSPRARGCFPTPSRPADSSAAPNTRGVSRTWWRNTTRSILRGFCGRIAQVPGREFDIVVWGASGFTGALVAQYLASTYGIGQSLTWALAGRNQEKLENVRMNLRPLADNTGSLPILLADSDDETSLRNMAGRTRVVCTTVGPYVRYGSNLVAACVAEGAHYCDLAGEVVWMRRMIDAHHESARANGTRIVHSCGFDSIPSDLGVHWLQREMQGQHGVPCREIKFRAVAFKGGFSGGTVASMLFTAQMAEHDAAVREVIVDPYALNPVDGPKGLDGPEKTLPEYDLDFRAWVTPFIMAMINTRVVRRSNALANFAYGADFRYDEGTVIPYGRLGFPIAAAAAVGSRLFSTLTALSVTRGLLAKVLPAPGEGPGPEVREKGYFEIEMLGRHPTKSAKNLRLRVRGDRDPGYGSTAKMLAESAICLALDDLSTSGGVLTPAVAMGDALLERLQSNAGVARHVECAPEEGTRALVLGDE